MFSHEETKELKAFRLQKEKERLQLEKIEGAISQRLYERGFDVLLALPAATQKPLRKDALETVLPKLKADFVDLADQMVESFLRNFNDYGLVRDRVCSAYARDLKLDTYGQADTRQLRVSIFKVLKKEGLMAYEWASAEDELVSACLRFAERDVSQREAQLNATGYDKGMAYERVCLEALKNISPDARLTGEGADYGADLLFTYRGMLCAGQCKAHAKPAGVKAVQEIVAAKQHYGARIAVVFSQEGFSEQAETLSSANGVVLVVGTDLKSLDRQIAVFGT